MLLLKNTFLIDVVENEKHPEVEYCKYLNYLNLKDQRTSN